MQSTIYNTKETLDYDNLNIITHPPPPPRRRQSGISLVPFRPYVKCLTSIRQPFSFANGYDKWKVMGRDEIFFTQPNARCIGSLIDDCDISDVIRWDIEAESTRLPMMCKLWMIVDGAIVERGKPHLVQDAAIQVLTSGRNYRTIIASEKRFNQSSIIKTSDRRRRQSWHDVNEYHSVPYYQYSRSIQTGFDQSIQCDMDNEHLISTQETLSDVEEETIDENKIKDFTKEKLQETIHYLPISQNCVHVSITTQTESQFIDRSTSIDSQFIHMFNLNLETNEILLSSIVNPYLPALSSQYSSEIISIYRNGKQYKHRSTSTGDDYPHWWLQLTTDLILSNHITNQTEEKEKYLPPPSPRQDQSIQTDIPSSRIHKSSSSSATTTHHYELINDFDDGNDTKRCLTFPEQRIDYDTFVSSLKHQSYSTPDHHNCRLTCHYCLSNNTTQTKSSESTSTTLLSSLLERYERTLRERQRAITIVNNELLDIDDVLKHYREKIQNSSLTQSNRAMEVYRDISLLSVQSKEDRSTNLLKSKYRSMPGITSEEMIQGYIPKTKIYNTNSLITTPRQRQPRFITQTKISKRPDYCDLCLNDHNTGSAWIKYNERRIEQLQKRIDLMLEIDDNEDALLTIPSIYPTTPTVTQRIDDILMKSSKHHLNPLVYHHDRILSPYRYQSRLPYRLNQSLPTSPRVLSRNLTRSTTPVSKSVRISTRSVPSHAHSRQSRSASRPIVSILRHSSVPATSRLKKLVQPSHVWKSKVDGKLHSLEQFSIPRYYRLYNDVSFREVYNFSRILDTYLDPTRTTTKNYSSMIKNFALEQQIPSPITSAA